jgi:hypothetical protein
VGGVAGSVVYQTAPSTTGFTAAGTTGQSLLSGGTGTPTWGTPATATNIASGVAGAVPYQSGVGATAFTAAGTTGQVLTSNGTSAPTWSTNIAGNSATSSSCSGNSATATQLQTSRTLAISGDVTGSASFDGSANATIAGTIANGVVTYNKLGTNEQKQIAKAWVNFDGTTATPSTIRSSYNVSSITNNGTGDYTVNFATPMADGNYSVSGSASAAIGQLIMSPDSAAQMTTASCRIYVSNTSAAGDNPVVCVQIFGN